MISLRSFWLSLVMMLVFSLSISALQPGDSIPSFSVASGMGQILIRDDLRDRKTLLFYEDRSSMSANGELKDYIKSLSLNREDVLTVVVVNCSDVGLLKKIWQERLIEYSRKTGMPVYGDWNGNMTDNFRYRGKSFSFLIVNEAGQVVYTREGTVPASEFPVITDLIE